MIFWFLVGAVPVGALILFFYEKKELRKYEEKRAQQRKKRQEEHDRSKYYIPDFSYSSYPNEPSPWMAFWTWVIWSTVVLGLFTGVTSIVYTFPQVGSYPVETDDRLELLALDTGMETTGRRYLFSGYIGEEPGLSYLTRDSQGGINPGTMPARKSTVFEGSEDPYRIRYAWFNEIPLVLPWRIHFGDTYDFFVPTGSVVSDYSVTTPYSGAGD